LEYKKTKSAAKRVLPQGEQLNKIVSETISLCARVVGSTLGPGGMNVLIERQEKNLPPLLTKDGVTVFNSIGLTDSTAQVILEAVREAASRTASEAGDGPQPLWSKVLTPTGFIPMSEVKVGMDVYGTKGSVQKVEGVYPKGKKEIIEVYFNKNRMVECCEDHLWQIVGRSSPMTTKQIAEDIELFKKEGLYGPAMMTPSAFPDDSNMFDEILGVHRTGKFTEMQCIKVSNPDHLYITDGYIVTHNTTTATILADAFSKATRDFCKEYPKVSPQFVVRTIENEFKTVIEPLIKKKAIKADMGTNRHMLRAVAKVSANGDEALADAVMDCYDLVGDEGNVTILEFTGPSKYEVERLDGYGIPIGYEDCCGAFFGKFINDVSTQSCQLENPIFLIYYGQIRDISVCANAFERIIDASGGKVPNIVLVATGFSETVITHLAVNASSANKNINVFPLLVPMSPIKTGQYDFMADLSALSGAAIFDVMQKPLDSATVADLGSVAHFEVNRFRSNILIEMDETTEARIFKRVDEISKQLASSITSELERTLLRERVGKLTGGIAKLKIFGSSSGELREKRDRAEDAICAVRGALKHGVLAAGGHTLNELFRLYSAPSSNEQWTPESVLGLLDKKPESSVHGAIKEKILSRAVREPVRRLFSNAGKTESEFVAITSQYDANKTYDLLGDKFINPFEQGLLDSTPAVLEALRNSISIATLMGTLGGTIVFKRDNEVDNAEASEIRDFIRETDL
jgi:chaperonin GroEL